MAPRAKKSDDAAALIAGGNTDHPSVIPQMTETIDDSPDKVPVFMIQGRSWVAATGQNFTQERPYQLMDIINATLLINDMPERFRVATVQEVKDFYSIA